MRDQILKWLPIVLNAVMTVETMFGPGKGKEKKDAALGLAQDLLSVAGFSVTDAVIEGVSQTIDGAVQVYNSRGVFTKRTKPEGKPKGKK